MSQRAASSNSIRSREQQFLLTPPPGAASSLQSIPCAVGNYGQSSTAVIVTHPFGPLGGNMHNNVVLAAVLYFQRVLGWTTCRFDFLPHSFFWQTGNLQVQQVKQVAQLLLEGGNDDVTLGQSSGDDSQSPLRPTQIILVGYSYGSLIAACASADIPQCVASISIAPAFGVATWLLSFRSEHFLSQAALRCDIHRLFVIGDEDNFTSEAYFQSTVERRFPSKEDDNTTTTNTTQAAILKGADHFFRRREKDLMAIIGQWLQDIFGSLIMTDPFAELSPPTEASSSESRE